MKKKGLRDINYERAQDFEIWQVARAATAAPFFFEPLTIEHHAAGRKISFTDGGFGQTNNPTMESKREVQDLHGNSSIGIVVSIGTSRKLRESNVKKSFFSKIPSSARDFADTATDPESVHKLVLWDHGRENGFPYYRINNPGGLNTELDEWEPKKSMFNRESGSKTIREMEQAFDKWASGLDVGQQLKRCAEELVECRRRRSETARWERYATGCQFRCRERACPYGEFYNTELFKEHLRHHHCYEEHDLDYELKECGKRWRYQAAAAAKE